MDGADHDASNANTSEESAASELKSKNRRTKGPMDIKQAMKNGEDVETSYDEKRKEREREKAIKCIAAWFYEAGIPLNAACTESFALMVEAIGQFGPGLVPPSPYELGGPMLQKKVLAINDSIKAQKEYWASDGCSIMVDTWIDDNGRTLMNLAVHCARGVSFLRSINVSSKSHDDAYLFQLIDSCIEEVGEKSVVHVVTNIESNRVVAKMLTAKRPNIFWTQCAANCINLMLEDIGNIALIKDTVAKARSITTLIYSHTHLLDMMRRFTNQWDLVQVGITDATTSYLNLKSLYDKRIELKTMLISKEWEDSKWSKEAVGKKLYNLVVSNKFWHRVLNAINIFEPLVEVLRRIGGGIPSMGYIYGELANAREEIASRFRYKEKYYLPVWNIMDKRFDAEFKIPLHLAGYYLNPFFYYQYKNEIESLGIFTDAVAECTHNMYKDKSTREKIMNQLQLYKAASKSFGRAIAIRQSTHMNLDPAHWWNIHGTSARELRAMAMRILNSTCSSSACERSWTEMMHAKKQAGITRKQLNDLAYVMINLRLQEKARKKDRDPLVPYLVDEDEPYEWLVDMDDNGHDSLDTTNALLTAQSSSSDEERPRLPNKKRKTSHASCSKQAKKPQSVEAEEEFSSSEECEESDVDVNTLW